ncbi:MAG: hypothetical protein ACNA8R_01040 [Nitriliruptoraceae bacterium]
MNHASVDMLVSPTSSRAWVVVGGAPEQRAGALCPTRLLYATTLDAALLWLS